jgi:Flp pilus assembly pilin Flp
MTELAVVLLRGRIARAQRLRAQDERGASVLEWALIAAVVVVAASIIGAVIFNIVTKKSNDLESCSNVQPGSTCGAP